MPLWSECRAQPAPRLRRVGAGPSGHASPAQSVSDGQCAGCQASVRLLCPVGTASFAQSLAEDDLHHGPGLPTFPSRARRLMVLSNINSRHSSRPRSQQRNTVKQSNKRKLMAFSLGSSSIFVALTPATMLCTRIL